MPAHGHLTTRLEYPSFLTINRASLLSANEVPKLMLPEVFVIPETDCAPLRCSVTDAPSMRLSFTVALKISMLTSAA